LGGVFWGDFYEVECCAAVVVGIAREDVEFSSDELFYLFRAECFFFDRCVFVFFMGCVVLYYFRFGFGSDCYFLRPSFMGASFQIPFLGHLN
jgi:hypothetical protein